MQALIIRALLAAVAAGAITGLARARGVLAASGQWAGFFLGVLSAAAGWAWAGLLVAFFLSSTALTAWRVEEKLRRTERILPRITARGALQVLANGGAFVLLALLFQRSGHPRWALGALGALAAASADTWSTEVGMLFGGTPRSIWSARALPLGMSGGVTVVGFLAALAGALFIAAPGAVLLFSAPLNAGVAVLAGGFAGCVGDSLVGGALQSKRYCDRCGEWTERRVHPCGYRTKHRAGLHWVTNDLVNVSATAIGALVAIAIGRAWTP